MGDIVKERSEKYRYLEAVPEEEFAQIRALNIDSHQKLRLLAHLNRINILYSIAKAGSGHIGTSFSSIDIMTWLFEEELKDNDLFFSSKGHDAPALYSTLYSKGLLSFDQISSLRRLGGLPGHPDRNTPGIVFNTGSLGMGISKAKGYLRAKKNKSEKGRVFVLLGDGELQEGQIWESLLNLRDEAFKDLYILIDYNKYQSDFSIQSTSDFGNIEEKLKAFCPNTFSIDGHDFGKLSEILKQSQSLLGAKVIVCNTTKGKGVSFMESRPQEKIRYQYHSGAPTPDSYEKALSELKGKFAEMSQAPVSFKRVEVELAPTEQTSFRVHRLFSSYSEVITNRVKRNKKIVCLDADLAFDMGLLAVREEFPNQFLECGIAEMDMVSQASGLAVGGQIPICHSFSCFLTSRPNEQIYNNTSERTKIIYVGGLAGLIPAAPGHSHQCLRDLALMGSIPGMSLLEPSCEEDVPLALDWALSSNSGSTYIRMCSMGTTLPTHNPGKLLEGLGRLWQEGRDGLILCSGPTLLREALYARQKLEEEGIHLSVFSLLWLNRVDAVWLENFSKPFKKILALQNHHSCGGPFTSLRNHLHGAEVAVRSVDEWPECGQEQEVLAFHKLNAQSIADYFRLP